MNIKSNNKIYKIGNVGSDDNNTSIEETMTPQELIEKLTQMGIIVNADFDTDGNIISVDDLKLNDISEFSLVNSDTEKKYTFTVDPHGKLIGRDESIKTIEVDLAKIFEGETYDEKVKAMNDFLDIVDDDNASQEYGWIRGFIPVYLNALKGKMPDDVKEVVVELAAQMMYLSGKYPKLSENRVKVMEVIESGKAFEKFKELKDVYN